MVVSGTFELYPLGFPQLRLEVRNASARDGAAVQVFYRRGGEHQRWRAAPGPNRSTSFKPLHCLSAALGSAAWRNGASPGDLHIWPADGNSGDARAAASAVAVETVTADMDGLPHPVSEPCFIARLSIGDRVVQCCAEPDAGVTVGLLRQQPEGGESATTAAKSLWVVVPVPADPPLKAGWYELRMLDASGAEMVPEVASGATSVQQPVVPLALDVQYAGREDGSRVQTYPRNCSRAQRWRAVAVGGASASSSSWRFAPACHEQSFLTATAAHAQSQDLHQLQQQVERGGGGDSTSRGRGTSDGSYVSFGVDAALATTGSWSHDGGGVAESTPRVGATSDGGSVPRPTLAAAAFVDPLAPLPADPPSRCTICRSLTSVASQDVEEAAAAAAAGGDDGRSSPDLLQLWWAAYTERGDGSIVLLSKLATDGSIVLCYDPTATESGLVAARRVAPTSPAARGVHSALSGTAAPSFASALTPRPLKSSRPDIGALCYLVCRTAPGFALAFNGVGSRVVMRSFAALQQQQGLAPSSAAISGSSAVTPPPPPPAGPQLVSQQQTEDVEELSRSARASLATVDSIVLQDAELAAHGLAAESVAQWRVGHVGQFYFFTSVVDPSARLCFPVNVVNAVPSASQKLHPYAGYIDASSQDCYLWAALEETDGHLRLAPSTALQWTIDVSNKKATVDGTPVQLWHAHGGRNQEFTLPLVADDDSGADGQDAATESQSVDRSPSSTTTAAMSSSIPRSLSAAARRRDTVLWATYHGMSDHELRDFREAGLRVHVVDTTPFAWTFYEARRERVACVISSQLAKGVSQGYISGAELCYRVQADALVQQQRVRRARQQQQQQQRVSGGLPFPLVVLVSNAVTPVEGRRSANIVHTPSVSGVTTTVIVSDLHAVLSQAVQAMEDPSPPETWSALESRLTVITDANAVNGDDTATSGSSSVTTPVVDKKTSGGQSPSDGGTTANDRPAAAAADNRFAIGRKLGSGAFGVVYKVFDNLTGEFLAMKQVELGAGSSSDLDTVKREVSLLASLAHPNVVQIRHADFTTEGRARLFLEWMSGGSLRSIAKQTGRAFSLTAIARYMRHALQGLQYLHGNGVVHRDIKPANLLLTGDVLKLADFGLALVRANSVTASTTATMTAHGLAGTPMYLSPEAVRGRVMAASDIWALGCTALELLTGELPWAHLAQYMDVSPLPLLFHIGSLSSSDQGDENPPHPPIPGTAPDTLRGFLEATFTLDPKTRPTAEALLRHPFVAEAS